MKRKVVGYIFERKSGIDMNDLEIPKVCNLCEKRTDMDTKFCEECGYCEYCCAAYFCGVEK